MEKLNTFYNYTFCDGTTAQMTLTFYALYQLKSKNNALYDRYNAIMRKISNGKADELDTVTVLYVAYLCANPSEETPLTEEEFIYKLGADRKAVIEAMQTLTNPKN